MAQYLRSTIEHLEAPGIHTRHLWRIQERVADRLECGGSRVLTPSGHNCCSGSRLTAADAGGLGNAVPQG